MKIAKVNITSVFRDWWESDLRDIFLNHDEINIISAVVHDGGLYLIYTYQTEIIETENEHEPE